MIAFLKGKKTYILVILGLLGVIVQVLVGDITFIEFLNSQYLTELVALLGLGTLRAGVSKIGG